MGVKPLEEREDDQFIVRSKLPLIDYPDISVGEYLARQLEKQDPNQVALIDPNNNGQLTFSQLHSQAQQIAHSLLQHGVTKQDSILFFSENCLQYVVAQFAASYLGITLVQLKPASGPFELAHRVADSGAAILAISHEKLSILGKTAQRFPADIAPLKLVIELDSLDEQPALDDLPKEVQRFTFDQLLEQAEGAKLTRIPHFDLDLERDHHIITYTSGTTGAPKGGIHSNRSFLAWFFHYKSQNDMPGKVTLVWNPLGHISGSIIIPASLSQGITVVLFAEPDFEAMMQAVQRYHVNQMIIAPSHARTLAQTDCRKKYDLSSLEILKFGGSKIAANLLLTIRDRYNVKLHDFYGATEFFGHVSPTADPELLYERFEPGNLGVVMPGIELKIADLSTGRSLPANQSGEIHLRGRPCFIGYLNNPKATAETIDSDGWYHSGDVGYYDARGCLFISDRIKELIKFRIWSIVPAEVEDFLYRHPAVGAVCVVGVPHSTDGYLLRAYVKLAEGKQVTEQELIDYVKDNMGFEKQLRAGVRFVDHIPVFSIGKVDRNYFKTLVKDELITEQVE